MAAIAAERVVRHLERAGFVVMKKPPLGGHSALGRGLSVRVKIQISLMSFDVFRTLEIAGVDVEGGEATIRAGDVAPIARHSVLRQPRLAQSVGEALPKIEHHGIFRRPVVPVVPP
jgi:hypothetical protein